MNFSFRITVLLSLFSFLSLASAQFVTDSHEEIYEFIQKQQELSSAEDILVVYDIDNTLLASVNDLGSDQWFNWQSDLLASESRYKLFNTLDELLGLQGELFAVGNMQLTDKVLPAVFAKLQAAKIDTFALTSRGPDYRNATERELKRTQLLFPLAPGISIGTRFIPVAKGRESSYQNGIFMTSGQHKGDMLKFILNTFKLCYGKIIFVDDHKKHTDRVFETFKNTNTEIFTFRYSKEDARVEQFKTSDKTEVDKLAREFLTVGSKLKIAQ